MATANEVAILAILRRADFLAAFDRLRRDGLALLLITFDRQGVLLSEVF